MDSSFCAFFVPRRAALLMGWAALAVGLPAHAAGGGQATISPSAQDLHAAQCVAALEVQTDDLAEQVKAGQEDKRSLLLSRLIAGTAFVGDSYVNSKLSEALARQLTQDALEAQKDLPPAELAQRQNACADEGTKVYASGNGVQRLVVQRLAKKRMGKLLGA